MSTVCKPADTKETALKEILWTGKEEIKDRK